MKADFWGIGDLVRAGLRRVGLEGAVAERTALAIWPEVVGDRTAAATRPTLVRDGILYVACRDSLWAQEIHFLRPIMVRKLNERIGREVIKEIRLSGAGFGDVQHQKEEQGHAAKLEKEEASLTERELDEIDKAASCIEDPALAERVTRGLRASRVLRKRHE